MSRKVLLRVRLGARDADDCRGSIGAARILALFGDVATALLVENDGDQGTFRAYESVELLEPVWAGDFVEAEGEIIGWGKTSRVMRFEARRLYAPRPDVAASAADPLLEPVVVCRATGTAFVARERRRRPPHPPVLISAAIACAGAADEIAAEAAQCRESGAALVRLVTRAPEPAAAQAELRAALAAVRARVPGMLLGASAAGAGTAILRAHALDAAERVDLLALQVGSASIGDRLLSHPKSETLALAARARTLGVRLELVVLDCGQLEQAVALAAAGDVRAVAYRLALGPVLSAVRRNLEHLLGMLPAGTMFAVSDVEGDLELARVALELGGHASVGLSDLLDSPAADVPAQVAAVAEHARAIGRGVADPADARRILHLA
jgi:uncharacterized protein (DUF849 family)